MKVLSIDHDYYKYPEGIGSVEEFLELVQNSKSSFVKLTMFKTDDCCFPYLVAEDTKTMYINMAVKDFICEERAYVLDRIEYDRRLARVVAEKCVHCRRYIEECEDDNLTGHRGNLSLDGDCFFYEKLNESDNNE